MLKQAEAEVVPSSSLVEIEVKAEVEVGVDVWVGVKVEVGIEVGVEVEVWVKMQFSFLTFFWGGGWGGWRSQI